MPGNTGWYENNFIQLEGVRDLAGCDQVTVVDGVECSAHHANSRSLGYHKDLVLSPGAAVLV
jgi:hypothetical protein